MSGNKGNLLKFNVLSLSITIALAISSGQVLASCGTESDVAAPVICENSSSINTDGAFAHGINTGSVNGTIDITQSGHITTTGASANGINAISQLGEIKINNSGTIDLTDSSATNWPLIAGIYAKQSGTGAAGEIYIENRASINVASANNAGIRAIADANVTSGGITIRHLAGLITSSGNNGDGLFARTTGEYSGLIDILSAGDIRVGDIAGGVGNHGIYANHNNINSSGDIKVVNQGNIINQNSLGYGIYSVNSGSGKQDLVNEGTITTEQNGSYGIFAVANSGLVTVTNSNKITTMGNEANGIGIETATGGVEVYNYGQIETHGDYAYGIHVQRTGAGSDKHILIQSTDLIITEGFDASGIRIQTDSSTATNYDTTVISSGNIITNNSDADGIFVARTESTSGNIDITASGLISLRNDQAISTTNFGIYAHYNNAASTGNTTIRFTGGTIDNGNNATSDAIWVRNNGLGNVDVQNNGTLLSLGSDASGIRIDSVNSADITVTLGVNSDIQGGSAVTGRGSAGLLINGGSAIQTLSNSGNIGSLQDLAITSTSNLGSQMTLDNYGLITGSLTLGNGNSVVTNQNGGVWELRNFADTDGDGIRDMKGVAVADFGSGNDTFINETGATLRLSAVSGATHNEPGGEFLVIGALSSFGEGTVHGQLINLNRFENSGTIDMTANGQAGDLLIITGSGMAGSYGGGKFVSNGGILRLDTHLNKGHNDSLSDILVVDDVILGANGPTQIIINRVDGSDELTEGNGIKVVKVLGSAEANSFVLGNVVKGGIYEYTLHQGEPDEGATTFAGGIQNWYLRNSAVQLNPDLGTYLSNQSAATGLFIHSLHDRLGEPQYAERYNNEGAQPSMWVRALTTNTKNEAGGGLLGQNTTGSLVHMGGDVAQWTSNGDNRYHLGLMAAYGKSETTSRSHTTGSRSKGKIDGYGAGAYFTWYSNESMPEGTYVDLWSMYNWFDNEVEGAAKYDSKAWTSSLEIGHAVTGWQGERMELMIEPHGQVAYTTYSADEHSDSKGLKVTDEDADGFYTRLGARTYLRDSLNTKKAQPFIEANWLHSTAKNTLRFNGIEMADNTPKDRFELKVGVQGEITKNLQVYSHIGLQWGKEDYSKSEGMLGLKYRF